MTTENWDDKRAIQLDPPEELSNLQVILVEPKEPRNIGSAARAMKGMGLGNLTLVNPPPMWRKSDEAWRLARSSEEILETAIETETLSEAVKSLNYLVGTTHRRRRDKLSTTVAARQAAAEVAAILKNNRVGIVFGREDKGLTTDELSWCQICASVPMAVRNPSLNLAHAVMIFSYEVYVACTSGNYSSSFELAEVSEIERLCDRVINILKNINFKPYNNDWESTTYVVRRAFRQREMEHRDLAAFHRIFAEIESYIGTKKRETSRQNR